MWDNPGSNRGCVYHDVIYSLGHGLRTFTAVPRSTQPSTLRGTVKRVSAYGLSSNNSGDGGCVRNVMRFPISLSTPCLEICLSLTPHDHLTILISARCSATLHKGQNGFHGEWQLVVVFGRRPSRSPTMSLRRTWASRRRLTWRWCGLKQLSCRRFWVFAGLGHFVSTKRWHYHHAHTQSIYVFIYLFYLFNITDKGPDGH